jgi:YVTN family beta-propeller protein
MFLKTSLQRSRKKSRNRSRIRLGSLAGLLALGLSIPARAQSVPFPTYTPGPQTNGTFVVSDGKIITPSGTQVNLGTRVRAKAIALNPLSNHTAAVLVMGTSGSNGKAVEVFNTKTGVVLQNYEPFGTDPDGSAGGIIYTPDGLHLLFSQDGNYGPASFVTIAKVNPATGLLSDDVQISVPIDVNAEGKLTNVTCFSHSPGGTTGSFGIPCGYPYSIFSDDTFTSYPTSIAISPDGKTALAVLDNNDTLAKIDLTASKPVEGAEIRVGNVPHSVLISPDGKTAFVSNEAGRIATANDFQEYSNGTPVVAEYPTGSVARGTVSVINLSTFTVTDSITVGHHPTGMAFWGEYLLVANTYDDTISVIDPNNKQVVRKIDLGLPIGVPGELLSAYGAGPNSIAVDEKKNIAYVALYNANAIAVVNLNDWGFNPVSGLIPVAYAPASVVLDAADSVLLVANDKGWGTKGNPNPFEGTVSGAPLTDNSTASEFGSPQALNTHQDLGTVSIVAVPHAWELWSMTQQVFQNNHWDLERNIFSAAGGDPHAKPRAIPERIGEPSKIKHVFVIIRENRTYDQILGDVTEGNGDPALATFGDHSMYTPYPRVTPNAHELVQRFPLFDNFYDPSRQSADGHNWITQAMAPYSDDIQSPDWLRDYPSNGGDAIAYQNKGHLWDVAAEAGIKMKNFGEYVEYNTFTVPGCTPTNDTQANSYNGPGKAVPLPFIVTDSCEPSWIQFYNDTLEYENGLEPQLQYYKVVGSVTPLPNLFKITLQNYPQFDLGIPDQYRFDVWQQDFNRDVAEGKVPQLEFMWISSDHTGGPPNAAAMQADNDLALGRFVDAISHSAVWKDSAIFVEEDDAQTGVDHVDGHRSPGYIFSPYVVQQVNSDGTGAGVKKDSTFYTQVNMTRTIEQILGLKPMNQNDLVASPMRTAFINDPPLDNFLPWAHVPNGVPLTYGVVGYVAPSNISLAEIPAVKQPLDSPAVLALRAGWLKKKAEIFAGKYHIPDSEDPNVVRHYDWYEATGFRLPYPGEKKVRPASDFNKPAPKTVDVDE